MRKYVVVFLFTVLSLGVSSCVDDSGEVVRGSKFDNVFTLPLLPPPSQYGNVVINRLTKKSTHPPVVFSHWYHRRWYTCRVCHFELNFALKTNATEITEEKNRKGEYCGACHNDRTAFGHTEENCKKCHSGNIKAFDEHFGELAAFPKALYGDRINWSKALKKGLISPMQSILDEKFSAIGFEQSLSLAPEWHGIRTQARFSHSKHVEWLDCADCHPDIFNIQKKGTKHMRMNEMVQGKFCGACHMTVAFPLQDCKRCHPDLD
ncbi:MAG: hypothetical protein M0042_11715 [Nitrospiraceae bacterium]|nr:hypothetical protein [Nitrospiraceae bacterium]